MAKLEKILKISVDAGYDSLKVVINGMKYIQERDVVDITGKSENFLGERKSDFYMARYIEGREHLVGDFARQIKLESGVMEKHNKHIGVLNDYNYFETVDFEISCMSAIGVALVKYAEYCKDNDILPAIFHNNLEDWDIVIGVALPNDAVDEVGGAVLKKIVGMHSYNIEIQDKSYDIKFNVKPNHVIVASQAKVALLGLIMDDTGELYDSSNYEKLLPMLLIDGGYKTIGLLLFTRINLVMDSTSNTDYAMLNVHEKVAEILQKEYGRPDIKEFNIDTLLKIEDGKTVCVDKNGETKMVDVSEIKNQCLQETVEELYDYLNERFDELIKVRSIAYTGGTGVAFYEPMKKLVCEKKKHLQDKNILTDYEFLGEKIDPVFGVAVGMYKVILNKLKKK